MPATTALRARHTLTVLLACAVVTGGLLIDSTRASANDPGAPVPAAKALHAPSYPTAPIAPGSSAHPNSTALSSSPSAVPPTADHATTSPELTQAAKHHPDAASHNPPAASHHAAAKVPSHKTPARSKSATVRPTVKKSTAKAPTTTTVKKAATRPAAKKAAPSSFYSDTSMAYAVLSQLNSERAKHGLPALHMNSALVSSAHAHSLAMARADTMSHQLAGEAFFGNRIANAGYNYRYAGENVGWNSNMSTSGACALETMMYNETPPNDGHRQNILSKNFRDVGISVVVDRTHNKIWLTEDFGGR